MMNRTDRHAHAGRAEQMMKATRDMTGLKDWAPIIKRDVHAIYLASRDVHAFLAPIIKRDVHAVYIAGRDARAFLAPIIKRNVHAVYIAGRDAHAFLAPIIKRDVHAVYLASRDAHANLASRDPRWYANVLAIVVIWINAITIAAASIALAYRYFAA